MWIQHFYIYQDWATTIESTAPKAQELWKREVVDKPDPAKVHKPPPKASPKKTPPKGTKDPKQEDTNEGSHIDISRIDWTFTDSKGDSTQICHAYHLGVCRAGETCPRSHACPVKGCKGTHSATEAHPDLAATLKASVSRGKGGGKGKRSNPKR